jgi:uncharacterized membrane protein YfhO
VPDRPSQPTEQSPPSVRILSASNTSVAVEAVSDTGGYVVLNDVWHPWWHARRGGEPVPVLRANAIFRAVAVPPGRHVVDFEFEPFKGLSEDVRRRLVDGPVRPGCRQAAPG